MIIMYFLYSMVKINSLGASSLCMTDLSLFTVDLNVNEMRYQDREAYL